MLGCGQARQARRSRRAEVATSVREASIVRWLLPLINLVNWL